MAAWLGVHEFLEQSRNMLHTSLHLANRMPLALEIAFGFLLFFLAGMSRILPASFPKRACQIGLR